MLFIAAMTGFLGAFLRGDVLVRALYDDQVRMRQTADTQVERNTDALVRLTGVVDKMAAVSETRDDAFQRTLDGISASLREGAGGGS